MTAPNSDLTFNAQELILNINLYNGTYDSHLKDSKLEILMLLNGWNIVLRNGTYEYYLRVIKLEILMLLN